MSNKEEEFLKKLLEIFRVEAKEHIDSAVSQLILLEKSNDEDEIDKITETIFRNTHSLKGASRSVDLLDIESICQNLESIFRFLKEDYSKPGKDFFDYIHSVFDLLAKLVEDQDVEEGAIDLANNKLATMHENLVTNIDLPNIHGMDETNQEKSPNDDETSTDFTKEENTTTNSEPQNNSNIEPDKKKPEIRSRSKKETTEKDTVKPKDEVKEKFIRMSVDRLNELMLKLEDTLTIKLTEGNLIDQMDDLGLMISLKKKEFSKMIKNEYSSTLVHDATNTQNKEQVEWITNFLKDSEKQINSIRTGLKNVFRLNSEKIDDLNDEMHKVLLLPFSTVLDLFPKMVRDIARDEEKEIRCEISGNEVEIDKRILDELKDPLIHIIRNSVDHGIESPGKRLENGKEGQGVIFIRVTNETGNKIKIEIEDDGQGIDYEEVYKKAIANKVVDKNKELNEYEKLNLIFESGISTSSVITDLSGRGLGLAIVKDKVELLNGQIKIKTTNGKGTKFIIELPASRASFRGIITVCNKRQYVFPTTMVDRVLIVNENELKTVEGKNVIHYNKMTIPVFHLRDVLKLKDEKRKENESNGFSILLVGQDKPIGFIVDNIYREQELILKGLGKQLKSVNNIMGTTILGDGNIATVLYLPHLVKNASAVSGSSLTRKRRDETTERVKILIAEDSITSRLLLVNILETAGYEVTSTVDGSEAFSALKENEYNLVVSDVDMPNMNGFELTERIRKDDKLKDKPVILVTALKSRADKERGMDVGANAYIVKSSFKPETLLNTIKKFT